jgi:uncharacterized protein (DUF2147 family)
MKIPVLLFFSGFLLTIQLQAQITGLWRSTDHREDTERSIVRIFEKDGKYYGRIEKLLPGATITHCTGCEGELKNKSLVGMIIIEDVQKDGNGGIDGKILDPTNGKYYSCDLELEGNDKLKIRGYLGFSMLGTTMYWKRDK